MEVWVDTKKEHGRGGVTSKEHSSAVLVFSEATNHLCFTID